MQKGTHLLMVCPSSYTLGHNLQQGETAALHITLNIMSRMNSAHGPAWQETDQWSRVSKDWKQSFNIHIGVCEFIYVSV